MCSLAFTVVQFLNYFSLAQLRIVEESSSMTVKKTIDLGNGHSIEIGVPTWDDSGEQMSIRSRYPTANGGFSPRSSSELPLADVRHIAVAAGDNDLLTELEISEMISALASSLSRKLTA